MTHDQNSSLHAYAKHDKSILFLRMVWIGGDPGPFIIEDGLCFIEGHSVPLPIMTIFSGVPLKA
jgi:hypothetical protein